MNSINLLPRVKPIERYFVPLLMLIIILSLSAGVLTTYLFLRTETSIVDQRAHITPLQSSLSALKKNHELDPTTLDYNRLKAEVSKLESARRDWMPIMNSLTSSLPKTARITNFAVTDDEKISIKISSLQLVDIANYVVLLEGTKFFSAVTVNFLTQDTFITSEVMATLTPISQ